MDCWDYRHIREFSRWKNVKIENEEKEDIEDPAIIAGSDYDHLELDLIDLFELMGIEVSEMIQGDGDETAGIDKWK